MVEVLNKNKLFGNAAIYLGANILNAGIPFLLLPILTRVLTPADYGMVAMFGIALGVLSAFNGLNAHGAIGVRYFQLERKLLAEYVSTCIGMLVVSTFVLFSFVAALRPWLVKISGVPSEWLFVAVALSGFQFFCGIRLLLWQASGEARRYGVFQITLSALNAIGSLVFILVIGLAWDGRILGQSVAVVLLGVIALWSLLRDGFLRFPKDWRVHANDALRFGVPLIPHAIGGLLIVAADRFVIVSLLDVAQAGVYMVALQLSQALGLLTEAFNKAYAPWLMKNLSQSTVTLRVNIVRGTYLYFVLVLVVACGFGIVAPFVFSFLVGESFRVAGELVIYLAIGFAFGGCYYMVTNYVFFASKTKILALITLFSGVANILFMFILVEYNGITGAAQAFMLTQALSFFCTWWLANKAYPMPWMKALAIKFD